MTQPLYKIKFHQAWSLIIDVRQTHPYVIQVPTNLFDVHASIEGDPSSPEKPTESKQFSGKAPKFS